MADSDRARVIVSTGAYTVDVVLPLYETVGNTIADLVPFLRDEMKKAGKDTKALEDKNASWTLATGLSNVLPSNETLDSLEIQSGDRLRLEKTSAKETYPALIDDVPDSIAAFQKQKFPAWDNTAARKLSAFAAPILSAVVSISAMYYAGKGELTSWLYRAPLAAILLILATATLSIAFNTNRKSRDSMDPVRRIGVPAASSGFMFLAAVGFVLVPNSISMWHALAAALLTFTVAMGLRFVTSGIEAATYVAITVSGVFILSGGLSLWLEMTPTQFGALSATLGLAFLIVMSSRLSMTLADIPMPFVPTMGESHVNPMEEDITKLPTSASTRAIESIVNRERQIVDAHGALVGLTIGGVASVVLATAIMAATMDTKPWIIFAMVMTVALAMIFRGKSYDDYMVQLIWLIGVITVVSTFLLIITITDTYPAVIIPTIALILAGGLIAVTAAVRNKRINSPIIMRTFEIFEVIINAAPIIYLAVLLDLYGQFRGM